MMLPAWAKHARVAALAAGTFAAGVALAFTLDEKSLQHAQGASLPGFPLIAEYRSVGDAATAAKFDFNVLDGNQASFASQIKAAAPASLVFIQPRKWVDTFYRGWAATYGGYNKETGCTTSQTGPVRAATSADSLSYQVYGEDTINWGNPGTGKWSADVRACHAIVDDGLLTRPIDGIWGDNHLWAEPDVGLSGAAATAWDNGAAANAVEMNRVLPGVLVGGNDASAAFEYGDYAGTVVGGDTLANFGMKESVQRYRGFYGSAGFDKVLTGILAWNNLEGTRGEVLNVNPGGLSSPLSVAQKRVALAGAVVSGAYLWLVDGPANTNDWANTVVPGDTGSIPQMGQAPGYPRGYLGRPKADPVHVAAGRWYRDFTTGYRVYANVTSSAWTVDGRTVAANDALFAAGAVPPATTTAPTTLTTATTAPPSTTVVTTTVPTTTAPTTTAPPPTTTAPPPPTGATLGSTAVGSLIDTGAAGYLDLSGPYAVGQATTATSLNAYMGGGAAASRLRGVVYADAGGQPGAFVAATSEVAVAPGQAPGWVKLPFASAPALQAGSYWLGFWYADGASVRYFAEAAGSERYRQQAYSASGAPPASFGTAKTSSSRYSLYATLAASGPSPPSASSPPAISLPLAPGQTLAASLGTWTGAASYSYQWQRCDASGSGCAVIEGAVGARYTVAAGDAGHTLRVSVTASGAGGSTTSVSAPSAVVGL